MRMSFLPVFGHKPFIAKIEILNQTMTLIPRPSIWRDGRSWDQSYTTCPLATMKACTKCHDNPSKSLWRYFKIEVSLKSSGYFVWETLNVWNKFCASPSRTCWDISLQEWKLWLKEESEDHQVIRISSFHTLNIPFVANFMTIQYMVAKIKVAMS